MKRTSLAAIEARDARIAALEAMPFADRTQPQRDELARLQDNRDQFWRRLPDMVMAAIEHAAALEDYARRHRMVPA